MAYQINKTEAALLYDEPLMVRVMYHAIREAMVYETGIAGLSPGTKLSEPFFYSLLSVPTISGRKGNFPRRNEIRTGLRRLKKIGLIEELRTYVFRLPKATLSGGRGNLDQKSLTQPSHNLDTTIDHQNTIKINDLGHTLTQPSHNLDTTFDPSLVTGNQVCITKKENINKKEKKPRSSKSHCSSDDERLFCEFYKIYPRRQARERGWLAWKKGKLDSLWETIKADLETRQWPDNPEHIPLPASYLNGKRWLDERPTACRAVIVSAEDEERYNQKLRERGFI